MNMQEEIDRELDAVEAERAPALLEEIALVTDTETLVYMDPATGEVRDVADAPEETGDILQITDWVGNKLAYSKAKIGGLTAEREALLKRIHDQYDPQIRHYGEFGNWCLVRYSAQLREYGRRLLDGKAARSIRTGLLHLRFGTTRPRVDVVDEDRALAWCEEKCPDAIQVRRSVLKSAIPEELKAEASENGFEFYPGGEETFKIE